jgi:hypothetical protein
MVSPSSRLTILETEMESTVEWTPSCGRSNDRPYFYFINTIFLTWKNSFPSVNDVAFIW